MKPLVIYHSPCADGFSAAWCFWHKYGNNFEYHPGVYSETPPDVNGREVYLVDFSYKRPVVEKMLENASHITILDHHLSAYENLKDLEHPNFTKIFDMDRSGATICWDYLFSKDTRPLMLGHVEDRDLWRFKLKGTREISAHAFSFDYTFENWDKMMMADPLEIHQMIRSGEAIERKHMKDVRELVAFSRRTMRIGEYIVPVANVPYTLGADAGHILSVGQPFAAYYIDDADGRVFGLRSAEDGVDVSKIAILYGGGGHKHAAGFKVPRSHILAQS